MIGIFQECSICDAKPGSPRLCDACIHNRDTIAKLNEENAHLQTTLNRVGDELKVAGPIFAFLRNVGVEYAGAMAKFPGNKCNVAATMEELGELSQALLEMEFEPNKARGGVYPNATRVYTEAVQVAAMAAKIAIHGSSEFPAYRYDTILSLHFKATGQRK